ncbi:MAG TPA: hypothetical protein QGF35_03335 [Dehalococcoidia bacterium]|nr:hypothetical protein [Dehalococcoidia bacterium]
MNPTDPAAAVDFVRRPTLPLRVIAKVVPEKWILFDSAKIAKDTEGTLTEDERTPLLESSAARLQCEMKKRGMA